MPSYFEFAPPTRLADSVECLWMMRHSGSSPVLHRVLPDGCADILFTAGNGIPTLQVVGAMTQFQDFQLTAGQFYVGLRFHPGMWVNQLRAPAGHIDLTATEKKVRDAGGVIVEDAFSFPGGRRFQFTDPSGNELAVWCEK